VGGFVLFKNTHIAYLGVFDKLWIMVTLSKLAPIETLLEQPLIRSDEAKGMGVSTSLLNHYVKSGRLRRVGRGLYVRSDLPPQVDFQWEELVYTVLSISNGVVCYTTALILHGLTDEIARQYWIAVPHDTTIAKRPRVRLVRMRNHALGISRIKLGSVEVPVYDLERALVEAFRIAGPEVAIKALKQAFSSEWKVKPNVQKMLEYAKKLRIKIEPYMLMVTT
jgi:predicted transcriptional regulator of viral defense system